MWLPVELSQASAFTHRASSLAPALLFSPWFHVETQDTLLFISQEACKLPLQKPGMVGQPCQPSTRDEGWKISLSLGYTRLSAKSDPQLVTF